MKEIHLTVADVRNRFKTKFNGAGGNVYAHGYTEYEPRYMMKRL